MSERHSNLTTSFGQSLGALVALPWMRMGVLPLLIVLLGGWWLCTIPPSPTSELPADWTPGGDAWTPEMHTLPVAQQHESGVRILRPLQVDPQRLLLSSYMGQQSGTLEWVDVATGASLARAADCTGSSRYEVEGDRIIEFSVPERDWPTLRFRDRETLQIVEEIRFRQADGSVVPAGIEIRNGLFWRRPRGEWGLSLTYRRPVFRIGQDHESAHYFATAEGLMREGSEPGAGSSLLDCTDCGTFPWPYIGTTHLISFDPKYPETRQAFDLLTETIVPVPVEISPWYFVDRHQPDPLPPKRVTPLRPGHRALAANPREGVVNEYSQPAVYAGLVEYGGSSWWRPQPLPTNWLHGPMWGLHQARRLIWQARYDSDVLDRAAARAIRVDAVTLPPEAEGTGEVRILEGDMRRVVQHELQVDFDASLAERDTQLIQPQSETHPAAWIDKYFYYRTQTSDSGAMMIGQRIHRPPPALTDAISIYRIGVLPPGSTTINWLGWIPIPAGELNGKPVPPMNVHHRIQGDYIVIEEGGMHFDWSQMANPLLRHQDGFWCAIPLPKALEEFREPAAE